MKKLTQMIGSTIVSICFLLPSHWLYASEQSPIVIYPSLYPPYDQIVREIATGIAEILPSADFVRADEVSGDIVGRAIVLGSPLTKKHQSDPEKIAGMTYKTYGLQGVILHIDTSVLIKKLLQVAPNITTVFLVGEFASQPENAGVRIEEINGNILAEYSGNTELAQSNGKTAIVFGIGELEKYPAKYLNKVVDLAWENEWVTVSSRPSFIISGLTLSITPDYQGYGRQLGEYYRNDSEGIESVKDVGVSVGVRSARHVGIDTRKSARYSFIELYP